MGKETHLTWCWNVGLFLNYVSRFYLKTNKKNALQECIICEQAVSENELNRFTNHWCSNSKRVFWVRCRHWVGVLLLQRAPDAESSLGAYPPRWRCPGMYTVLLQDHLHPTQTRMETHQVVYSDFIHITKEKT